MEGLRELTGRIHNALPKEVRPAYDQVTLMSLLQGKQAAMAQVKRHLDSLDLVNRSFKDRYSRSSSAIEFNRHYTDCVNELEGLRSELEMLESKYGKGTYAAEKTTLKGKMEDLKRHIKETEQEITLDFERFKKDSPDYVRESQNLSGKVLGVLLELEEGAKRADVKTDMINKLAASISKVIERYFKREHPETEISDPRMTKRSYIEHAIIKNNFTDITEDERRKRYLMLKSVVEAYESSLKGDRKKAKPFVEWLGKQVGTHDMMNLLDKSSFEDFKLDTLNI